MAKRLIDCPGCACLIDADDPRCPFCGANQRHGAAPLWLATTLLGGLGLAGLACDLPDVDTPHFRQGSTTDSSSGETSTSSSGTTSTTSDAGTTLDDTTTSPDASTYGGPDDGTATIATTTGIPTPESSTSTGPDGTATMNPPTSSSDPGTSTFDDTYPDASTYAGPDESESLEPTDSLSDSADNNADASSESSDGPQQNQKDGCACNSRARPSSALLALIVLGARRRKPRPRR